MTTTLTKTVASTAATASSTVRATPQGGILEGGNPTVYNSSNPIILFIIQVNRVFFSRGLSSESGIPRARGIRCVL